MVFGRSRAVLLVSLALQFVLRPCARADPAPEPPAGGWRRILLSTVGRHARLQPATDSQSVPTYGAATPYFKYMHALFRLCFFEQ